MSHSIKNNIVHVNNLPIKFHESPNSRNNLNAKYLILHFTASDNFENVLKRFADVNSKVSAHFVCGRNGELSQCVSLNRVSYHAGTSSWKNIVGLNGSSIGIEMVNFGPLTKKGNKFYSWTNKEILQDNVYIDSKGKPWHAYTHSQLETVFDLAKFLVKEFCLIDVINHSDVSPGRKTDSGPAFDIEELRYQIFGRKNHL